MLDFLRIFRRKPEKPNYAKIFAVTVSVIAAVSAIALVVYKLFNKYFKTGEECEDYDECPDEEEHSCGEDAPADNEPDEKPAEETPAEE